MKKIFRISLGIVIAAVFMWLILKNININEMKISFRQANVGMICASIFIFLLGYACRIQRWKIMLSSENSNISWKQCSGPLMASIAANNVLPLRAGDFLRAFGFNSRLNVSATTSLTTLVVERLLDMLMLLVVLGIALYYFNISSSAILGIGSIGLLGCALIIFCLLLFPGILRPICYAISKALRPKLPTLSNRLNDLFTNIFSSLEHMSKNEVMLKLIFWSICAWFLEGAVFWLIAMALPTIANTLAAWLAFPVGTLSTLIPGTPGYVGTFDYFTSQSMIVLGNDFTAAATFVFIVHFVLWLPPTLIGGVYLLFNPVVLKRR